MKAWCWVLESLLKSSAWEQWMQDRVESSEESEEVTTKSRMWLLLWVGKFRKFTGWIKLKEDRSWDVRWSMGVNKLKSPVMMNLWGMVAAKRGRVDIVENNRVSFRECGWRRRTIAVKNGYFAARKLESYWRWFKGR